MSSRNNNNHNKNKPRINNEIISALQQFPPMRIGSHSGSSTPSSTPGPGPPPFGLLSTPIFDKKTYKYELHPATLAYINADANIFGMH